MLCSNCEDELEPVFFVDPGVPVGYSQSMDLTLDPGEGERFEGTEPIKVYLCPTCSDALLEALPGLEQYILNEIG